MKHKQNFPNKNFLYIFYIHIYTKQPLLNGFSSFNQSEAKPLSQCDSGNPAIFECEGEISYLNGNFRYLSILI